MRGQSYWTPKLLDRTHLSWSVWEDPYFENTLSTHLVKIHLLSIYYGWRFSRGQTGPLPELMESMPPNATKTITLASGHQAHARPEPREPPQARDASAHSLPRCPFPSMHGLRL